MSTEITKSLDRKTLIIGGIDALIIIGLSAALIFRSPAPVLKIQDNEKVYRDSISAINKEVATLQTKVLTLNKSYDSLSDSKVNIQNLYKARIKFLEHTSNDSLVSILRRELRNGSN